MLPAGRPTHAPPALVALAAAAWPYPAFSTFSRSFRNRTFLFGKRIAAVGCVVTTHVIPAHPHVSSTSVLSPSNPPAAVSPITRMALGRMASIC